MPSDAQAMRATAMAREIAEIPEVVARQLGEGLPLYREAGALLRAEPPRLFVTSARGSSDHAATFFKYLMEVRCGIPVASIGPSVGSVYDAALRLEGCAVLTISQSGASPDLVALQERAAAGGARTLALLNHAASPVGVGAQSVLPLLAGPERAVAATKSFVASLVAVTAILAGMTGDDALLESLTRLPDSLARATAVDWAEARVPVAAAASVYTISRGPGLAVALEAALKLKETCGLHGEAFSAAELRHGPIALAGPRLAALVFVPEDRSRDGVLEAAAALHRAGARVFATDETPGGPAALESVPAPHPLLAPICQAASLYRFAERLAASLDLDPDQPPHLAKVTETL